MKNKTVQLTGRWLLLVASLLACCDPFNEDFISKENQFVVDSTATDYYILSNTPAVIDLRTIVRSLFTDVTIAVSGSPTRGSLTSLNDFLLKYTPSASFIEGKDQFEVMFTSSAKIETVTITVHMATDVGGFPCSLYAVEDYAHTTPGAPVSIKILRNDRICGIKVSAVEISVFVNPKHGQAIVAGDSIIYTSENDFEDIDEIIYKITPDEQQTSGADSLVISYGVVQINVSNTPCPFFLLDSCTLDLTDDIDDVMNSGDCAGGYGIPVWGIVTPPCSSYGYYIHEIEQSNKSGHVCFGRDGGFSYHPDPAKTPANDSAKFEVCVNGQCKEVAIYIIREKTG